MKRFKTSQIYHVFIMLILGVFLITGCGSGGGEVTEHWAPARTLTSILVTPATYSVPVTGEKQFTATAVYSDGTSIDVTTVSTWTSINLVNASVGLHTGIATGKVVGTSTTIKADYGGLSGSGTLNVNAATSVSFVVTPKTASIPVTGTKQYTALEIFSDGSIQDRTSDPGTTWNSGTTSVATLDSLIRGRFTGVNPGTSTITAVYGVYTGTFGGTVGIANRTAVLTVTDAI